MSRVISMLAIAVLVAADRVSKIAITGAFGDGGVKKFLFGLFQLRYTENTGAAFSFFSDNTAALSVFTVLIIILCLFVILAGKVRSKFALAAVVMITAGGIGNAIDRIMNGFVVDFIEPLFMNFAVFNVADICITVGAFLLIAYEIYQLFKEKKDGKRLTDDEQDRVN